MAGYTYLGQFIDHDLTLDITPLESVTPDLASTTNFRTPFLDLDQLYGGGPSVSRFLYRKHGPDSPVGAERFLLGTTKPSDVPNPTTSPPGVPNQTLPASCNDLPRNSQGVALVGDSREDENLVLAQLHIAFLKLHNLVLDRPELRASPDYHITTDFQAARRVVTWHYQWLVRQDFLRTVLDPEIFDHLDSRTYKPMMAASMEDFRIPVEFSAAAFRFGHSMVRNKYHINQWHDADLAGDLLGRTGFGPTGNVPLPEEWVINWKRFFIFPPPDYYDAQNASRIDTSIASGLFQLPVTQIRAFSLPPSSKSLFAADPPELPIRTLLRGARMGLPSGQDVARAVCLLQPGIRVLKSKEIAAGPHEDILTDPKYRFHEQTPLWYYILKEAEVLQKGNRLGPVGSRIIADVIVAALAADPKSYINVVGPKWTPTLWTAELEKNPLEEMRKLLELVAPNAVTKACSST